MCPIVSFSNEKSTTDQKKSPLRFILSSDFIIENNCNINRNYSAQKTKYKLIAVHINKSSSLVFNFNIDN
jgi:hypothetical protein